VFSKVIVETIKTGNKREKRTRQIGKALW
jgi:hypothetical protein